MIELMILFVLLTRDLTMYSVRKRITTLFCAFTIPSFGALDPALKRLEKQGCLTSSKVLSDGGKVSIYYSITKQGEKILKTLLLKPLSKNPLKFLPEAKVKLCCASVLQKEDLQIMLDDITSNALLHKIEAQKRLEDEYNPPDAFQKLILDNTICEYKNFISLLEGLSKSYAGNNR